jgi:aminoglycoside phosphotransferase (APT) family kinase protein
VLTHWDARSLDDLLAAHGLADIPEEPFPNDGWSGAKLTLLRRGSEPFVLKRTSWATDWIARATRDHSLREAFVATGQLELPEPVVAPYLGAAADGSAAAILMPDLSGRLFAWERPEAGPPVTAAALDIVLRAVARLHASPVPDGTDAPPGTGWPWTPHRERLELLGRPAARRYADAGLVVGPRFLEGWDAFDRLAPPGARDVIERLAADSSPLVAALDRLPAALLHGDLKLANVALLGDGRVALIDWQMVTVAPVAVELGWLLVSNAPILPLDSGTVLARYRSAADDAAVDLGDWVVQVDLAHVVGLLLRGWRKGLDAQAGIVLASGASATDDLALWAARAVEAADRRL